MISQSTPMGAQFISGATDAGLAKGKGVVKESKEGVSLLDVAACGSSSDGSSRSSSQGSGADQLHRPTPAKSPLPLIPGSSIQKKFVDMLSPLLVGNNKVKRYIPSTPPPMGTLAEVKAALLHYGRPECKGDKQVLEVAPLQAKIARATSQSSGLQQYGCKPSEGAPKEVVKGVVAEAEASKMPSIMTPSLERLLKAARHCNLPPSPSTPEPGTPNYPTIMLSMSLSLPQQMQRKNWCLHDYAVVEKLYTGYASTVYKGLCKTSGQTVVLKVYTLAAVCDLYKYQIYREIRVHASLQHENIVHLYAAFQEGDKVIMVEEYADGNDLFTLLHKYGGRMSERLAVQMVLEPFLKVLSYLHSKGIIHRDIKPENIMFSRKMCLKLGDFGLALDMREERAVTRAGTLDYMAPEVLKCPFKSRPEENKDNRSLHYGPQVDSWALGVMTYELLVGCTPFFDHNRKNTEELIKTRIPALPPSLSEDARHFLSGSLDKNALQRPTIHDMLHHPWVEKYRARRSMRSLPHEEAPSTPKKESSHALLAPTTPPKDVAPALSSSPSKEAALTATTLPPGAVKVQIVHKAPLRSSVHSISRSQHKVVVPTIAQLSQPIQLSSLKMPPNMMMESPKSPSPAAPRTPHPAANLRIPAYRSPTKLVSADKA